MDLCCPDRDTFGLVRQPASSTSLGARQRKTGAWIIQSRHDERVGSERMTAFETTVPLFKVFMAPEASERVKTVLESGFITQGPVVEAFEAEMRAYLDNEHVLHSVYVYS